MQGCVGLLVRACYGGKKVLGSKKGARQGWRKPEKKKKPERGLAGRREGHVGLRGGAIDATV